MKSRSHRGGLVWHARGACFRSQVHARVVARISRSRVALMCRKCSAAAAQTCAPALVGCKAGALAAGNVLRVCAANANADAWLAELLTRQRRAADWGAGPSLQPRWSPEPVARVLRGLEYNAFTAESQRALFESAFRVGTRSDRMGYRLEGPRLTLDQPLELLSSPIAQGTVQVPPGGNPIVLMADRQTVGGYPRIAQVITVNVPLLAQAAPGARVRFQETTIEQAHALFLARERDLHQLATAIQLRNA